MSDGNRLSEHSWQPDILGSGFAARSVTLSPDDDPSEEVTATVIRAGRPSFQTRHWGIAADCDVLYIHGWSDYFFQTHLAQYWRSVGARFFALDLRRYGRSLREGQLPGYVSSLDVYDEDIEAALELMGHGFGATPKRRLVLMGHSTGGLILSLWASKNPGRASMLILNSPWLELQTRELGRLALTPVLDTISKVQPKKPFPTAEPGFYMRTVSDRLEGEWTVDPVWHPDHSFPVYPGWLRAVMRGHQTVASGLNIEIPILVLLSRRSVIAPVWDEQMRHADVVLDVEGVARRSLNLGECTTVVRLEGAMHDVFLSERSVRERAFESLTQWLRGYGRANLGIGFAKNTAE